MLDRLFLTNLTPHNSGRFRCFQTGSEFRGNSSGQLGLGFLAIYGIYGQHVKRFVQFVQAASWSMQHVMREGARLSYGV